MNLFSKLGLAVSFLALPAFANMQGLYIGANGGQVGFTGAAADKINTSIGYGVDVGLRTSRRWEVAAHLQNSAHSGLSDMRVTSQGISIEGRPFNLSDMEITVGAGAGVYLFHQDVTEAKLGINIGGAADIVLDKHVHIGTASRVHFLSNGPYSGNYWTLMLRVGYVFDFGNDNPTMELTSR